MLLVLASAVFLGSESFGSRDHILLSHFWDFLFVASYDSQGHGGGILPRLHTADLSFYMYYFIPLKPWSSKSIHMGSFLRGESSVDKCLGVGFAPSGTLGNRDAASVRCCRNVYLASRWLEMDFRFGSTIPAFRRHVTCYDFMDYVFMYLFICSLLNDVGVEIPLLL
jgi:hypothetical protein